MDFARATSSGEIEEKQMYMVIFFDLSFKTNNYFFKAIVQV